MGLSFITSVYAGSVSAFGTGGPIPPNAPLVSCGILISDIAIPAGGIVASGNAVTVILKGLQHDWSGDLIATLSYVDTKGTTRASANLFYRVGETSNNTDGSWTQFGAPGPTGDNYLFNTDFPGNIWSVAAALGSADFIPGLQTDALNGGKYFTTDAGGVKNNLSYAFAGLFLRGGTWRLTITDASDHSSEGQTLANVGSLVGWEIDIQAQGNLVPKSQSITTGSARK